MMIQHWQSENISKLENLESWLEGRGQYFTMPIFTTFTKESSFDVEWKVGMKGVVCFTTFYKVHVLFVIVVYLVIM